MSLWLVVSIFPPSFWSRSLWTTLHANPAPSVHHPHLSFSPFTKLPFFHVPISPLLLSQTPPFCHLCITSLSLLFSSIHLSSHSLHTPTILSVQTYRNDSTVLAAPGWHHMVGWLVSLPESEAYGTLPQQHPQLQTPQRRDYWHHSSYAPGDCRACSPGWGVEVVGVADDNWEVACAVQ